MKGYLFVLTFIIICIVKHQPPSFLTIQWRSDDIDCNGIVKADTPQCVWPLVICAVAMGYNFLIPCRLLMLVMLSLYSDQ